MAPTLQARAVKAEGRGQECSLDDAGMRGPDPANPIVQAPFNWDEMWGELLQALNVPPDLRPGRNPQPQSGEGGSQPLPDFRRGKLKKKKRPGKDFGTGGETGPGDDTGPGDTTKFEAGPPDAPSYYSQEASGCIRSTMTVLQVITPSFPPSLFFSNWRVFFSLFPFNAKFKEWGCLHPSSSRGSLPLVSLPLLSV
jgi:hypothetical protein